MKKRLAFAVALSLPALLFASLAFSGPSGSCSGWQVACADVNEGPPVATPKPTHKLVPSSTPEATPSPSPSSTLSPSPEPSVSASSSPSPSVSSSPAPSPSPSPVPAPPPEDPGTTYLTALGWLGIVFLVYVIARVIWNASADYD